MNQMDAYNKHSGAGHGTLIGNWHEEKMLREKTGEGRTVAGVHQAKIRDDLYRKPPQELNFPANPKANTFNRTMPSFRSDKLSATSKTYGVFDTRPDALPKVGQRHHLTEKDFFAQANADWETHKKQFDPEVPMRSTTSGSTHGKIPFSLEPLGKRVIKSQDGKPIPLEDRDFEVMVDAGFMEPRQKNTDEELRQLVDNNVHYSKDVPYSYWQEKLESGAFYMSEKGGGQGSFAKNNKFLKEEFKDYRHTLG